ncbi:hypothetical protein AB1Y20_006423 [Prymnesium parvum]|uniref:Class I SAM-dependent methyltransferase n=1 Tax=Prymnesium parvum TaxID=97485 RepID=A0AB34J3W1_PRYPA
MRHGVPSPPRGGSIATLLREELHDTSPTATLMTMEKQTGLAAAHAVSHCSWSPSLPWVRPIASLVSARCSWLAASLALNLALCCCSAAFWWHGANASAETAAARRLSAVKSKGKPAVALVGAQGDCASMACPRLFTATPKINLGLSRYRPFIADTRYRLRAPGSMLELTRMLYGKEAQLGEPFLKYANPYGKKMNVKYQWTQINEAILRRAVQLLPRRPRFVVEVGSFTGRSSVLIGDFLRKKYAPTARFSEPPQLLCIDTWLGDLGMTIGAYLREIVDKRHGQPTIYHQWLVNIMSANLTRSVLPLVTTSFLGARILDHLRLHADLIYLDSAHEQQETFFEIAAYWAQLAPGGILLGDDLNWAAVMHDAQMFARIHQTVLNSFNGCHEQLMQARSNKGTLCVWYMQKPLI